MMTLAERYAETGPAFKAYCELLAAKHAKSTEQIYAWWREYCDACQNFDQSPVQFEFENWYAASLNA